MAGYPAYIAVDLALTALGITGALLQDSSNYPADNIADGILANTSRLTYLGGNFELHIVNSPWINYDSVAILNHSMRVGSTLSIKVGTAPGSGGSYASIDSSTDFVKNAWYPIATQTSNTYVRIEMTPLGAVSGDSPVELGEVVVGTRTLLPRPPRWGVEKRQRNTGIDIETLGGVQYAYELSKYKIFRQTFRFPESQYAAFLAFSDAVGRDPFVYIPDVTSSEAYYVRKARGFDPYPIGPASDGSVLAHWYDWTLELRTESEGLAISA